MAKKTKKTTAPADAQKNGRTTRPRTLPADDAFTFQPLVPNTPAPNAVSQKKSWFENEDFWKNYGPIMFDSAHWAEAPGVAAAVQKIAGLKKGARILDAGCGPGRISVELALLGLDVTGVDIIQAELDAAAETADDEGVDIALVNADLRTYTTDRPFDAAVNLYTSFGYCDTMEEDVQILRHICGAIKDDGWFIMERLDLEACLLYRGEETIELTSVEFRIMRLFMEEPGKVFTKQQIYETGWDDEYVVSDNNIMVCISKLRAKLEHDGREYIKTVRGLGYRLEKR